MKVVVVGKGGREHALAKKLQESSLVSNLWVLPGNAGMVSMGLSCVQLESPEEVADFCQTNSVALAVLGPETAILSNLKSLLEQRGIACCAPSFEAAQLEASKSFCKRILQGAKINTAAFAVKNNLADLLQSIRAHDFVKPLVLKADGLAQGKGVWVCENLEKALEAGESLAKQFGFPILLEEYITGQELSAFALCDGKDFVLLGTACDYKRINSDPFSANTGGMGAYSPCDFLQAEEEQEIQSIFSKTLEYLYEQKIPYQGFLFAGLMRNEEGLFVLEYNVRMGDPETQVLLPRIESDFAELIEAAMMHDLKGRRCELSSMTSVHVVAASRGYPFPDMSLGSVITLPEQYSLGTSVYFAGVKGQDGRLVNSGGRVLGVTASADSKEEARKRSFAEIKKIAFDGMLVREDVGR